MIGIGVWAFFCGLFVITGQATIAKFIPLPNSHLFELAGHYSISYPLGLVTLVLYFSCLGIAPSNYSVLSFTHLFKRLIFLVSLFGWLLYSNMLFLPQRESAIISFIVTFVTANTNKFVIFISLFRSSRISLIWKALHNTYPLIATAVFSIFIFFTMGTTAVVSLIYDFVISSLYLSICASIAGERTSFSTRHGSVLVSSLSSSDPYIRLLAYIYLDSISTGSSTSRDFIYKDPSRSVMIHIMKACSTTIHAFQQQNWQLQQFRSGSAFSAQIANSQYRQNLQSQPIQQQQKGNFISNFLRERRMNAMQLRRETFAIESSIPVIYASSALGKLATRFASEDQYGVGQASMKDMKRLFTETIEVVKQTQGYRWHIKSFGKNWVSRSPAMLINTVLRSLEGALNNVTSAMNQKHK